ncbi:hypothetical protein PanWU01x14_280660 [Parasponia andersonii]|uniref:Uncharacterized protein n=1 Tax=Parasponia andersonii TaxID=3476 RepID=A0A2P5B1G5_PARAD|nr:hypothetical protein PanWU01x14_280660 [Parasponia andersonii]
MGPTPRSCTMWTVKWQGAHHLTRVQNDHLKTTRIARDTIWTRGLSEAKTESIPNLGQLEIRSLEGFPPEDHWRQRAAPDPDRAFNAILDRYAHWADRHDKTAVCQSLAPTRIEPESKS